MCHYDGDLAQPEFTRESKHVARKQLGAWPVMGGCYMSIDDRKGGDMQEWPADLRVREWPGESR